jgi:hypothetical protein
VEAFRHINFQFDIFGILTGFTIWSFFTGLACHTLWTGWTWFANWAAVVLNASACFGVVVQFTITISVAIVVGLAHLARFSRRRHDCDVLPDLVGHGSEFCHLHIELVPGAADLHAQNRDRHNHSENGTAAQSRGHTGA